MIKSIINSASLFSSVAFLLMSSISFAQNVQQDQLNKAKTELEEAHKTHLEEIENFKDETKAKVKENNYKVFELYSQLAYEQIELKEASRLNIAKLEARNLELRNKLESYEATNRENWGNFKAEFNHEMNELTKALNNFSKREDI